MGITKEQMDQRYLSRKSRKHKINSERWVLDRIVFSTLRTAEGDYCGSKITKKKYIYIKKKSKTKLRLQLPEFFV